MTTPKSKWIWLPVCCYYIETPKGKFLFDTGWHRDMSPDGVYDKRAQIRSLGSRLLYNVNQGVLPKGDAVDEQLAAVGVRPSDLDYVLLSHLDCDHANGLKLVAESKNILVSRAEMDGTKRCDFQTKIRFQKRWWNGTKLRTFDWNGTEGPVGKSYDVLGNGSFRMVNIPGHSAGLCALKITNADGKFVLLFADEGYATKSWKEMITSGIALDKEAQKLSLAWIREQSMSPDCVASIATHDADVNPHVIEL
jgi:glyoxylase-like metal-dependent hydrolase (beta-lactamase superfamily II)